MASLSGKILAPYSLISIILSLYPSYLFFHHFILLSLFYSPFYMYRSLLSLLYTPATQIVLSFLQAIYIVRVKALGRKGLK